MLLLFNKKKLDELSLDHAPFAAAGRDRGDSYLIKKDHPEARRLRSAFIKAHPDIPWGPRMWREFHEATGAPGFDHFLEKFVPRLPNGECACRQHFVGLLNKYPPPVDPVEQIGWGVFIHDKVNVRLGKPVFGWVAAANLYDQPARLQCAQRRITE